METTKVVLAQSESKSLRTTIPAGIARQFGIIEGSELGWEIKAQDNELVIVVRPLASGVESSTSSGAAASSVPAKRGKADRSKGSP